LFLFAPVPFKVFDLPHWLTMLIEGQGYIVAMLAVYIQGRGFLWPECMGTVSRKDGYVAGLRATWSLYLLVLILLAIAAVWEAFEVIYLQPMLGSPLLQERIQSLVR
jgi:hypothetical protein